MNSIKILIVENEILIAEQVSTYLEQLNYEVCGSVESGEEALEVVEQESPDLVLMDIELDGELDGVDTAAQIQENLAIPIIYLSRLDDHRTLKRVSETLPAAYLTKPFKNHDIRNAIEMAMYKVGGSRADVSERDIQINIELSIDQQQDGEVKVLKDRIFYRTKKGSYQRLLIKDLVYLESARNYTIARTTKGDITIPNVLKQTFNQLGETSICRTHRQFAVNTKFIDKIDINFLTVEYQLKGNSKKTTVIQNIPLSNSFQEEVMRLLLLVGD